MRDNGYLDQEDIGCGGLMYLKVELKGFPSGNGKWERRSRLLQDCHEAARKWRDGETVGGPGGDTDQKLVLKC